MFPSLGWIDALSGLNGRLNATARALDDMLDQVIEEHMNNVSSEIDDDDDDQSDKKDFVDILLQLRKDGMLGAGLTRDNLKAILLVYPSLLVLFSRSFNIFYTPLDSRTHDYSFFHVSNSQDMFVGGTDTTSTALEWAMAELVKNPTSMKRAQEEIRSVVKGKSKIHMKDIEKMDYLKCVVKETLRLHPSLPPLVPRETATNLKWRGYDIPAKTRVFVNAWAIQRDPQVWDNPEDFLPDRFLNNTVDLNGQNFQFIPFGAGRRGCPGISFALAAIEYVIANLLYWFDWKLPRGEVLEDLDMIEVSGLAVHKKLALHLVPTLYSPYP